MLSDFTFIGARQIQFAGRFFAYYSATNPQGLDERLKVYADGDYIGTLMPGDRIRDLPKTVREWYLEPITPSIGITVMIGSGLVDSNNVAGAVRIIDDGITRSYTKPGAYDATTRTADATRYSMAGILAGAKPFAILRMWLSCTAAADLRLWFGTGAPITSPATAFITTKLLAKVGTGVLKSTGLATQIGTAVGELPGGVGHMRFFVPANEAREVPLRNPLIVPAGWWYGAVGSAVNTDVNFGFEGEEIG